MSTAKPALAAVVAAALLALAGCGSDKIAKAEVEKQVAAAVAEDVGVAPDRIVCPGDLDAEVDAKTRCVLVAPDQTELDTDVRVTSVDGSNARFDVQVGTTVYPAGELTGALEEGEAAEGEDDDRKKKQVKKTR